MSSVDCRSDIKYKKSVPSLIILGNRPTSSGVFLYEVTSSLLDMLIDLVNCLNLRLVIAANYARCSFLSYLSTSASCGRMKRNTQKWPEQIDRKTSFNCSNTIKNKGLWQCFVSGAWYTLSGELFVYLITPVVIGVNLMWVLGSKRSLHVFSMPNKAPGSWSNFIFYCQLFQQFHIVYFCFNTTYYLLLTYNNNTTDYVVKLQGTVENIKILESDL